MTQPQVKITKAQARRKYKKIPDLRFDAEATMTRFGGLVLFQSLFATLKLKEKLQRCFSHVEGDSIYRFGTLMLQLIVQILIGKRRLRGRDHLVDDALVNRVVGVSTLSDVSTMSRMLSSLDPRCIQKVRAVSRELVLDRLEAEDLGVVTIDFDGSVQSSKGHAEGTAVGFNKVKKGARSYYPLLATVAQTGQVLDLHHRAGNVHDSNGAPGFMSSTISHVRSRLPKARLESRFDSAFFNQDVLNAMTELGVQFTCSVPFARFPAFKKAVESTEKWTRVNATWSYADSNWRPKSWDTGYRVLLARKKAVVQRKGPVQLDLFEPVDHKFEYKVIVTNMMEAKARTIIHFHNGRGSQENIIGECKQYAAFDVVATRTLCGNQAFTLAGILAHNLGRELQMRCRPSTRSTLPKRPARWVFQSLGTLRDRLIHRAGRLTWPQHRFTLQISAPAVIQVEIEEYMTALNKAA